MTDLTIADIAQKVINNSRDIDELRKTFTSTDNFPNSMQITYTDELKSKTFDKAPFLRFLENKNQVFDNKSALVGFYVETEGVNDVNFINELEALPSANPDNFIEVVDKMKTIAAPIEVSMMSQMGNTHFDLLKRQQDKKFIKVNNLTDKTLLEGLGTPASKDFKGLTTSITSNVVDLKGAQLTEGDLDDLLATIIDDNGGTPDVIVTTANVAKRLKQIVAPLRRYNDKIDIGLGHRVVSYESLEGTEIPILVDSNFNVTPDNDKLAIVDSSTIEVRRLMPPTLLTDLPTDILGYKNAIATFLTAQNIAEFQNGLITGIGDGSP